MKIRCFLIKLFASAVSLAGKMVLKMTVAIEFKPVDMVDIVAL